MNEQKFLNHIFNFLETQFRSSADSISLLKDLIRSVYETGVIVGFYSKTYPREKTFMAVSKREKTICTTCNEMVFPMWTRTPKNKADRGLAPRLFWWCDTCCEIRLSNQVTIRLEGEDATIQKRPQTFSSRADEME